MKTTDALHKRLEQRLATYVAMPTVSSDTEANKAALRTLAEELQSFGLKVSAHGEKHPWLVATTRATKHVRVLLHAHLDVVPENEEGQFTMHANGDQLIGRGVFDMKFAVAVYMELLAHIAKQDDVYAHDLGVLITTDEEVGGRHGVKEFLDQGWSCDVAIIPDGGRDFKIERRAKGFLYAHLDAKGLSAHGSRPWEADNPIPKLIPALEKILKSYPNNDSAKPTLSITGIETPSAFTQIPHLARARLDGRAFDRKIYRVLSIF